MATDKKHIQKDVVIIGAGMAGLTAALYAGRMNLSVLVLENGLIGGQIANATGIENDPGLPGVSGKDLIAAVQGQAEQFGAVIDEFDVIQKVSLKSTPKRVETEACVYEPETVIIASGMERRKLPLAEEAKYAGKGVHYCELCDGHLYRDKAIAVMGGGNAAVDAANFPEYLEGDGIRWNFTRFLIDREGNVVKRFEPTTNPSDMKADIEALL